MSDALEVRAELAKLARLLSTEPTELVYLEELPAENLRALRYASTDLLFDGEAASMSRLASAAKVLPAGVLATIAEKAFGPLLCARIAGYLDPDKAVDVAAKLSPEFLADVAVEIDPRKAGRVIGKIPPAQTAAVTEILTAREEIVTMGRFVGHLEDPSLAACIAVIPDEQLLPIAFVLEDKDRLEAVLDLLSDERAARVAALASEAGDRAEVLELAQYLSEEQAGRLTASFEAAL